ncbi:IS66 family transposase [Paucibacter aquatile]|uniref:IS66 family transposase n=1 Tax=Kinneretia aquatilis TaxID=2070761 RepID=A0A2N8L1U0_9BURK|nr:IS66 family transposase [Paucibacter aquatile]PND39684.1 IS66 family transposase [Paucibacter aquatile]
MFGTHDLPPHDLQGLPPQAAALIEQMRQHIAHQADELQRKDREIALREAKIEKISFELARLKRWKFGAKTEAMSAEQRRLFEETLAEDEAGLQAQLDALRAQATEGQGTPAKTPCRPRRQALPEHLRRVEHHHEPENTCCPSQGCGRPMTRIGEDVSERLDIVPAEFFVHRHIYGKWACRCCQVLKQQAAAPEIIDGGMAASGLLAHTLISRFADHLPYYRQEAINARSGVHTPRSTLAAWAGQAGAALMPLYDAHKRFVLNSRVLHADETPVALLDPGAGRTRRAYVWAYARSHHDPTPGVVYDFCPGRGAQYPLAFLAGDEREGLPAWAGTLMTDRYGVYDTVLDERLHPGRRAAACVAHARRKFDELAKAGTSAVGEEAIRRFADLYATERELAGLSDDERRSRRQALARPQWSQLKAWLALERRRVADGGSTAAAIDYTLKHWGALTQYLDDGAVPIDNNHLERQIKPWAMGRKAWMFIGSELAGQRAAVVMSLVQSARMCGHEPLAYLRDVLQRLPTQLNSRIEELLPHRWQPV